MARVQSSIDSSIYYGPRTVDVDLGYVRGAAGATEVLVYKFPWDNLPSVGADDAAIPAIPAGAVITKCTCNVTTLIAGATDFSVGTIDVDGGNADIDSLITTANAAVAVGVYAGTGALINGETQDETQVTFSFVGSESAGEMEVRVEYTLFKVR